MAAKKTKNKPVIKFRQTLFWDVDPKTIDPKKHARYVIERILDFGNTPEVKWMRRYYSPRLIKNTLKKSRVIHKKSRSLWSLIFR
ncbi:MAG: hypothetical protein A3H70_02935 [Candidatus Komeilibacteria bacterium RIFCSPLOWO2_02_FULL_48_11]|uniref:DUF6922 domain-containing protein n=1 Tax=Candidatus Komeilibacteria bacterium RIFCSPLOWO2_02_FULL_48_11 TaxID=1798553 RepID=A0A1G2BST3_9BACT|nr:MAG: hypothetical protein A3H70_02935 [Candidatus Komeilibacteria bacterium RIFCSPLOWO2_02_FULL_48_11]